MSVSSWCCFDCLQLKNLLVALLGLFFYTEYIEAFYFTVHSLKLFAFKSGSGIEEGLVANALGFSEPVHYSLCAAKIHMQ